MKTKHTAGPWKIIKLDGETWINPEREEGEFALIARVNKDQNAQLIAAAPDLYESLYGMLEWARRIKSINPGMEVSKALNALRKAEGR